MEVGLQHSQAAVNHGVAEAVREEAEVGEARIVVVGVVGSDVAGPSSVVYHILKFRHDEPGGVHNSSNIWIETLVLLC